MQAILISSLFFILLFFPISIKFEGVLSNGKGYFCISIYSIAFFGGYLQINWGNLNVYLNKKVFIVKISDLINKRGRFSKLKRIVPYSFKSCLISGVKNTFGLKSCVAVSAIRDVASPILIFKFPWIKLKNDIFLTEDDNFGYVMQLKCWANIYSLISLAINYVIEGIKNGKRDQRECGKNN